MPIHFVGNTKNLDLTVAWPGAVAPLHFVLACGGLNTPTCGHLGKGDLLQYGDNDIGFVKYFARTALPDPFFAVVLESCARFPTGWRRDNRERIIALDNCIGSLLWYEMGGWVHAHLHAA